MASTGPLSHPPAMAAETHFPPHDPREWLNRARSSLCLAAGQSEGVYLEDLCYAAQEAAEKAIKAVLIARRVGFPYIHRLRTLLDLLEAFAFPVPREVRNAAKAASFPPAQRYPSARSVSAARYARSLEGARSLVDWAAGEIATGGGRTGAVREPQAASYDVSGQSRASGTPDPDLLAELVARILPVARPERIILFGSAARGTMHAHSDLDVMVVKPEPFDYDELTDALEDAVYDLPVPVDVLVATPEELERYGRSWCLVYCPALEEGRVIYERGRDSMAAAGGEMAVRP
jgi:HEPN domain-containing protein/predicted nucleotidyltransferase